MFFNPHFTFNNIYSKDMNVCIASMDNDMFNDIGIEYSSNIELETNLIEYNPYFIENPTETSEIELNLLLYNPYTMEALPINKYNMEEIYDWLITDDFAPFISDDDRDIVYYFKLVKLSKALTFGKKGYLKATFKPYSKYCYKRNKYEINVNGTSTIKIYNPSKINYQPIFKITNLGSTSTENKINDMIILGLETNETVTIDNLAKIIQDSNGINKFNCCNRRWQSLSPRTENIISLSGKFKLEIICEFPIIQ